MKRKAIFEIEGQTPVLTLNLDWTFETNLLDADELDLLRFSFEPWILLWLELIALDVNVFARLSPRKSSRVNIGNNLCYDNFDTFPTILRRCEGAKDFDKSGAGVFENTI